MKYFFDFWFLILAATGFERYDINISDNTVTNSIKITLDDYSLYTISICSYPLNSILWLLKHRKSCEPRALEYIIYKYLMNEISGGK